MNADTTSQLRLLVVIANHGSANQKYLSRVIGEYRAMPYLTHIVVLSNIPKDLGPDVEVIVGLPARDPWSLPFGHKQIMADRIHDYDLFVYSEDDILMTQENVEAFLRMSAVLPDDEIAGFFRFEKDGEGKVFYPDVHGTYHWESRSLRSRGGSTFAFFTNEHAGCYMLTRGQLRRAVESGGFLVGPHSGKYDLLVSAATDPYTECGVTKLICISHLDSFLVHHLSNKYAGRMGLDAANFERQIGALLRIAGEGSAPAPLHETHSELKAPHFGENYYESTRTDLVGLVPATATTVLSVGCGWGATEESLIRAGKKVVAVPLEPIISICAEARGVATLNGDLDTVLSKLSGEKFDCLVISGLLHTVQDPGGMLAKLAPLLSGNAVVITTVPNLLRVPVLLKKLRRVKSYRFLGDYAKSGLHFTSRGILRRWFRRGGLRVDRFVDILPKRAESVCRVTRGLAVPFVSSEIVAIAVRA